jgi:hypothetical protein
MLDCDRRAHRVEEVGEVSPEIFQRMSAKVPLSTAWPSPAQPFFLKSELEGRAVAGVGVVICVPLCRLSPLATAWWLRLAPARLHGGALICPLLACVGAVGCARSFSGGFVCRTTSVTDNGQTVCLEGGEASPTGRGQASSWAKGNAVPSHFTPACRVVGGHVSRSKCGWWEEQDLEGWGKHTCIRMRKGEPCPPCSV